MLITCDPGVDDLFALMVLAGNHELSAVIATAGNVDAETAALNASAIVSALGADAPVARGPALTVQGSAFPRADGEPFHGPDGLGGAAHAIIPSAPPEIISWLDAQSVIAGHVLATGPLTAAALALRKDSRIERITWMGGSIREGGNITAAAEFNAWLDAEAADEVLQREIPIGVIPLDVTHRVPLTETDFREIEAAGDAGRFLFRASRLMLERDGAVVPHDAIAAAAALHPELFTWSRLSVRCETDGGLTRGATIADRRSWGAAGHVDVATDLDPVAVRGFLLESIEAIPRFAASATVF